MIFTLHRSPPFLSECLFLFFSKRVLKICSSCSISSLEIIRFPSFFVRLVSHHAKHFTIIFRCKKDTLQSLCYCYSHTENANIPDTLLLLIPLTLSNNSLLLLRYNLYYRLRLQKYQSRCLLIVLKSLYFFLEINK